MMAGLPVSDLGARCRHGNSLTMFCTGCHSDRMGAAETWEQHESAIEHEGMTQQSLWDMQDAMRGLNTAVQGLTQRLEAEKKNPPLFPEEG